MKYSLYPGRFQPLHPGHKAHIQKLLDEGKNVCVLIRNTEISKQNPYNITQRIGMIMEAFPEQWGSTLIAQSIPDFEEIVYGRNVGYKIREVRLDAETEDISATKIRNSVVDRSKPSR